MIPRAAMVFLLSLILATPSIAAPSPTNSYEAGDVVVIGVACKTEAAIKDLSAAAMVSQEEFGRVSSRYPGICGMFRFPVPTVLERKVLQFTDYENDLIEVWQGKPLGGDEPIFFWLVARGRGA